MAGIPHLSPQKTEAAGLQPGGSEKSPITSPFKESIMNSNAFYTNEEPLALAMRPRKAAAALGISLSHLERLTKAGEIPAAKAGRCTVYPVDVLKSWLSSRTEGGSNAAH
jgi:excisionase family DNA binding protein